MKQIELEFETMIDGFPVRITYNTDASDKRPSLYSITLHGFPLDVPEMICDKQFTKFFIDVQWAMEANCVGYWADSLQAA